MLSFSQPQTCQYNFDAIQQYYDGLWNNQYSDYLIGLFPISNGQKFSFTVAPPYFSNSDPEYGTFNYLQYLAASKKRLQTSGDDRRFIPPFLDSLGDLALPNTGILALEMQLDIPASPLSGGYYGENPPAVFYSLDYQNSDGTEYNAVVNYYNKMTEYQSKYHRLGVYINQNTKQVGFIVNGVDQGYQGTLPAPLKNIGFDIRSWVGSDKDGKFSDKLAGLEFSSELITDRNALQFSYPQGATDICGNEI